MKSYIGVKQVKAEPMTSEEFNEKVRPFVYSGACKEGYKVTYADGYESWSPKKQFEEAYRATDGLTFGLAVEAAKQGYKIARTGWNGKWMFVVYQKGYLQGIPCNEQTAEAWGMNEGDLFDSMWVPSINDALAEDWYILD